MTKGRRVVIVRVFSMLVVGLVVAPSVGRAQRDGDIDAFMEEVLKRREANWITLHDYVLDEEERFVLLGPGRTSLQDSRRVFTWYVREGYLIRSPVQVDGVNLDEETRREYENEWLRQERRRQLSPRRQRESLGGRSTRDNVRLAVERLWGDQVSDELLAAITDDARLWGDDLAALVAATDRIVADLGGVEAVGFDRVVERTRDAYVMLETDRLDRDEIARVLTEVLRVLSAAAAGASRGGLDGFIELVELAAAAALPLPGLGPHLDDVVATLEGADAAGQARALAAARDDLLTLERDLAMASRDRSAPVNAMETGLQPRFVSESYFLDFEFEPGNYYFAGREELAGREVVKIEYYPERLFRDEVPDPERDQPIEAGFDRTSLVTLWIDPEEHQIVKFTFDNVGFDFLPYRWLVRLDDLQASMVMGQPIDGVWLPEQVELTGKVTMANGSYEVTYTRAFSDYRQAEVKARIRSYVPPQDPR